MRGSERRPLFAWLQTVDIFQWTFVFLFYQANFGWNRVRVFDFLFFFFFLSNSMVVSDMYQFIAIFQVTEQKAIVFFLLKIHFWSLHFGLLSILVPTFFPFYFGSKNLKIVLIESLMSSHWWKLPTCHMKCIVGTWSAYMAIKIIIKLIEIKK